MRLGSNLLKPPMEPLSYEKAKTKLNSMVLVRKRTIPTERPRPVGEVSANISW
jgi:hypothetical protein